MTITLDPEQEAWLSLRVARGDFVSVEDGARQLIGERITELERESLDHDDLEWTKPLIEEGLAQLDRGESITLEEFKAQTAALLASLK